MTGIVLLDAAIGIFFALLVYSLAATSIHEAIANLLNLRGKALRAGIYRFVSDSLGPKVMGEDPIRALHGPGSILG
ncbi:MAG TPA: hypothetical protein VLA52_09135, partial [Thermohalobaculum sp.]|nr:hypothetical protein [Thermohalobaculum sp.]